MKRTALALAVAVSLYARLLQARTPEIAVDPTNGIWIAQDDKFIFQTLDRWTVFSAGATVNKLVVDQNILWIATDDGVIRFETGSQRSTKLTMDDGLPSQRVSTVAFDDQYVWFGTNKGLVRYRKTDRTLKLYDESNGLPNQAVTYAVTIGRQVWFGTRAGIAVFSPDVDGLRSFGEADGMASGDVAEVFQFGADLWCRTDLGLSRFRVQQRVFNNFPMSMMGAQQIFVMAVDGQTIWLGTDNGLWMFDDASDSIRIFPQQDALGSKTTVGVEPTSSYVYITTDKEILQYNRLTLAIRRFTTADRLTRQEGSTGSLNLGSFVTVMFPDAAVMYNVQLDQWFDRSLALTVAKQRKTVGRIFGQLESQEPLVNGNRDASNSYANATGGFGIGRELSQGRTLNGSGYLDYGQLDASGIRDLQYKIEYLGNQNDVVRDIRIEDKLKYRYIEEGLDRQLLLQGAHVGVATPGAEPKASMTVDAGFRRGQVVRDFITGPRQDIYQLSQKYILPGTDRVYVDGELLNAGVDYTIVYTAGQLLFLNPERIDDLSVIIVEYERDLVPKKSLGNLSLSARLPVTNEIGTWALTGTPTVISTDTGLYAQIDGGAPKYIQRGWVSSVYASYQQGSSSLQVSIHDMGTEANAESIFQFDLPVSRLAVPGITAIAHTQDAAIDTSLPTAYYAEAYSGQYYIEVNISDHSDAALAYIKTFTLEVFSRGTQAGQHLGDQFKEWMVAARGVVSPVKGMDLGARVVQLQQVSPNDGIDPGGHPMTTPAAHLTNGVVDGRYQTPVGEGGLLTSYFELGGSHDSGGARSDGLAGMGFLRLSSPRLEGTISGRLNTESWTPIGHTTPGPPGPAVPNVRTWNDARFGTLRDQTQLNVTGYPLTWLPVTALFTRERAWLPDGTQGTGVIQHAIARVQLNKAGLPATTLQFGSTELDNPNAYQAHRLQGSAQTDYDLAPLLSFTHINRFNVRALYSLSQGETDQGGVYQYSDRVRLIRLEGKLSPTATETINALFRSRDVGRQTDQDGPYWRSLYHWELISGAQSTIIPGLVPKVSYNLTYDDNRMVTGPTAITTPGTLSPPGTADLPLLGLTCTASGWSNTGPAGSAICPVGPGLTALTGPTRTTTGSVGGALGIYPGQWFSRLGPLAFVPSVAIGDSEGSANGVKTEYDRIYDLVSSEIWAGRKLEMQLYQRYRFTTTGSDAHSNGSSTTLRNSIVYRPIFTSPITLYLNYQGDRTPVDTTQNASGDPWSLKQTYDPELWWLMRWNQVFTTRTKLIGTLEHTSNYYTVVDNIPYSANHSAYMGYGEIELRFYPLPDVSALFVFQRMGISRLHQIGDGAYEAWEFIPVTGVILRMGDRIYLDGTVTYDHKSCISGAATACSTMTTILPHVYFTMNL